MADNKRRGRFGKGSQDDAGDSIFDLFEPPPEDDTSSFGKIPIIRDDEESLDLTDVEFVEAQAAAEAEAAGLAHWTEPATGQVPAALGVEGAQRDTSDVKGPSWRGEGPEWVGPDLSDVFADTAAISHERLVDLDDDELAIAPSPAAPPRARSEAPERPHVPSVFDRPVGGPAPRAPERPVQRAVPAPERAPVERSIVERGARNAGADLRPTGSQTESLFGEPRPRVDDQVLDPRRRPAESSSQSLRRGAHDMPSQSPATPPPPGAATPPPAAPTAPSPAIAPPPTAPAAPAAPPSAAASAAGPRRTDQTVAGRTPRPAAEGRVPAPAPGHRSPGQPVPQRHVDPDHVAPGRMDPGRVDASRGPLGEPDPDDYDDYEYEYEDDGEGRGRSLGQSVLVGIALAAVVFVTLGLGPIPTMVLVGALTLLAVMELFNAMRVAGLRPATLLGLVGAVALPAATYVRGDAGYPLVIGLAVVFGMLWYLTGADTERPVLNLGLTFTGIMWIGGLAGFAALMLRSDQGIGLLMATIIVTAVSDTLAYVGGRAYGTKSFHSASPNKTWEGTLTGFFGALFAGLVLGVTDVIGAFDGQFVSVMVLAAVVGVLAPIGDLAESLVKRDLGIKDMGTLLPGHGGVLDRVDGLLFALPGAYYVAVVYQLL